MSTHNRLFAAAALLLSLCAVASANEAAVGVVGGCSFVCISPDGLCLTAEHCGVSNTTKAIFHRKVYDIRVVYQPPQNKRDEAVAFRLLDAKDLPYAPLATRNVEQGDVVWTAGFPGIDEKHKSRLDWRWTGRVDGRVTGFGRNGQLTWTNHVNEIGHSGGPLFNDAGEVVGLASSTAKDKTSSTWIGWPLLVRAAGANEFPTVAARSGQTGKTLVVFITQNCSACHEWKRKHAPTYAARGIRIEYVTWTDGGWDRPDLVEQMRRQTGIGAIEAVPFFWAAGTKLTFVGLKGILEWIARVFRIVLLGEEDQPLQPVPQIAPLPQQPSPRHSDTDLIDKFERLSAQVNAFAQQLQAMKKQGVKLPPSAEQLIADYEALKGGSIPQRIAALTKIRGDIEQAKADLAAARKDPSLLWSLLPGLLMGLLKRGPDLFGGKT